MEILRSSSGSPVPTSKSATTGRKESVKGGLKRAIVAKENIAKKRKVFAISSTSMDDIPSLVHHILFREVYRTDNDQMWFDIGRHKLKFSIEEFEVVLGLHCVGDTDQNRFMSDDIRLKENKDFNNYPWEKAFRTITFKHLRSALRDKEKINVMIGSKKGTESCKLYGFPLALQLWFYECMSSLDGSVCESADYGYSRILNWKSSRSPHYEDLETNIFGSKKIKIKGFSLSDVEKKRPSVGWNLNSSEKIGQDDDDFEDPPVRVTRVTETSTSTTKESNIAFQFSPSDILFDLPEDQMEGVVVGEATNDKEKETVADSVGASNKEIKKPENEHNDEKQDDASQHCIQSENLDKVNENIEVSKDEEHQDIKMESCAEFFDSLDLDTIDDDESKAIVPYIGSSSECKFVEFTSVVSKREPKPRAQLKSPYINIFGSSKHIQEPKKNYIAKRKVKGLYPFKTDLLAEADSNMDTKFNSWFEKGLKPDN
ncbi:hypothetical protein PanWU01x14_365730, partial [Parasponia andersonii]